MINVNNIQNKVYKKTINNFLSEYVDECSIYNIDLSRLSIIITDQQYYTNGKPLSKKEQQEAIDTGVPMAACWTSAGIIYFSTRPSLINTFSKFGMDKSMDFKDFCRLLVRHEASHEIWGKIFSTHEKDKALNSIPRNFTSVYLNTLTDVDISVLRMETFCEWLAVNHISTIL